MARLTSSASLVGAIGTAVRFSEEPPAKGMTGAVDRYVAMTRATQQLVILTNS